jgi:hypothetical protein
MNEVERLPEIFKTEITKVYADAKPGRRAHILGAVARLRAKYNQKLVGLRAIAPARAVDDAERAIRRTENEFAATLTNAA